MRGLVSVAVALALVLAACDDEPSPVTAGIAPAPPPADQLETIDLCGDEDDTRAFLASIYAHGGLPAVRSWIEQNVELPANLRVCVGGDNAVRPRVARFYLQSVDAYGHGQRMLIELGPSIRELAPGAQTLTQNVFPDGPNQSGFGIGLHYYP